MGGVSTDGWSEHPPTRAHCHSFSQTLPLNLWAFLWAWRARMGGVSTERSDVEEGNAHTLDVQLTVGGPVRVLMISHSLSLSLSLALRALRQVP